MLQACCRRLLRAVEAVGKAKRVQAVQSCTVATVAPPGASAQSLAKVLAPGKVAEVSTLLDQASMKGLCFGLQAEQSLWNAMQSHSDECRSSGKTVFLFVDLTAKECLPMWLTPDQIGGKFCLREEKEWALHGGQAISKPPGSGPRVEKRNLIITLLQVPWSVDGSIREIRSCCDIHQAAVVA